MDIGLADWDQYLDGTPNVSFERCELLPLVESAQVPPIFLLGGMPAAIVPPIYAEFLTGPVRLYVLSSGRMTIDGIVIHNTTALSSVMFNHPDYHVAMILRDVLGGQLPLPVRRIEGMAVMFSGPGYNVYGHWLVDILPRLWVLHSCGYDVGELSYVVPAQIPTFVEPLLATFGIRKEQIIKYDERREILEVESLLVPTNLRRASRIHSGMAQARDFLLGRRTYSATANSEPRRDRIFVSRSNADFSRTLRNRERIEQLALEAGFHVVYPEEYGFAEQIDIFAGSRQIIGEYGSGLHNSMFSPLGTVVCALRGTSVHPGFIQTGLGHVLGHSTGYVFGDTPLEAIHQSFEVDELLFRVALKILAIR